MKTVMDLTYGPGTTDLFDLYLPENDQFDLLIWFHGGGLESGSRKDCRFAADLTEKGLAVASVEYRLYPGAKFPDYLQDAARAAAHIIHAIAQYGTANRIYLSGQSAGAWMTLMLALDGHYLEEAGADRSRITGFISDSAQVTTHFNVLRERGIDPRLERLDDASPLYHLSPESRFGELLLIWYENDLPCRPEQNLLFRESAGKLCPHQRLVWAQLPGNHCEGSTNRNPEGRFDFCDTLLDFLG